MMKRIMITILAVSALQADVFAADRKPKRTAATAGLKGESQLKADLLDTREELNDANGKLTQAKNKRCTRRNAAEIAAEIAALTQSIEDLEDQADVLREQINEVADTEQERLNEELALNAANRAELEAKRSILELGDANGDNADAVAYDIDGALVIDKAAYTQLQITRIEIAKIDTMLTSARESEALLSAKLSAQSSVVSWVFSAVKNFWYGTSSALATTQEKIRGLEANQALYSALLPGLKAAACRPLVAAHTSDEII